MQATYWIVTGPYGSPTRKYKTVQTARNAVDRLDMKYGASAHFYQRIEGK